MRRWGWGLGLVMIVAAPVSAQQPAPAGVMGGSGAQTPSEATPARGPVRISGGVMAGAISSKVSPSYPAEARAKGISGAVVMQAVISKAGAIESLQIVSGPEELRQSAWDAVKQWRYKPYLLNGEPTEVQTTITVNYSMQRPAAPAGDDLGMFDGPPEPGTGADAMEPGAARISGGVMAGSIVKKVNPSYPAEARAKRISGAVVLRAIIGKDGAISKLRVMSGPEELRASALEAVRQWRYTPYMLKGQPTEVDTTITVNYNIGGY